MSKQKIKPPPWLDVQRTRIETLAAYNAERARGIVHTAEWDERMATLQARFDANLAEEAQWRADEHTVLSRRQINLETGEHTPLGST